VEKAFYIIRDYSSSDYSSLLNLWKEAGLSCRPEGRDKKETIERELEKGVGRFFLAEIDSKLIGVVLATHDGRKGWINRLAIIPAFRRQSIAVELVKIAESWLEEQGMDIITCLIEDDNLPSKIFFQKMGYLRHDDISYFSKRKSNKT